MDSRCCEVEVIVFEIRNTQVKYNTSQLSSSNVLKQGRIGLLFQAGSLPSIQATRCVAADPAARFARAAKNLCFFSPKKMALRSFYSYVIAITTVAQPELRTRVGLARSGWAQFHARPKGVCDNKMRAPFGRAPPTGFHGF